MDIFLFDFYLCLQWPKITGQLAAHNTLRCPRKDDSCLEVWQFLESCMFPIFSDRLFLPSGLDHKEVFLTALFHTNAYFFFRLVI